MACWRLGVSVVEALSGGSTLRLMAESDESAAGCRVQRLALPGGAVSWTVLGADHAVVGPAEEFLEFLRVQASSPNTVKSYARALALWWSYLELFGLAWVAGHLDVRDAVGALIDFNRTPPVPAYGGHQPV